MLLLNANLSFVSALVTRHPGCRCPVGFQGPHCESLSAERNSSPTIETVVDSKDDDESEGGLSTAGIVLIVIFVDLLVLAAIGRYFYKKRQRQAEVEKFDGATSPTNLMAHEESKPPTLENILAMGSLADSSESSLHSHSERSNSCSLGVDGLYRVDDRSTASDLVNVAII